ncbi:hypothetical protein [Arthrobacter sp. AQ5-05]|uniref:hypothetical protein n=1 Tax=Arthrobacter sp. AQ5-05 TaxID=2184581 RepID=UPI000AF4AB3C|nr:hypothetical protein [Arthrobacter sp. AQ5-05]
MRLTRALGAAVVASIASRRSPPFVLRYPPFSVVNFEYATMMPVTRATPASAMIHGRRR